MCVFVQVCVLACVYGCMCVFVRTCVCAFVPVVVCLGSFSYCST